ncbi:MAG TPA: Spy/CpxP family protein refolding chaperone [Gammaproteobacteria bacterium]
MNGKRHALWAAPLLLAGCLLAGTVQADDTSPGPGYGWGMMGGGYYGMGPGMMGGYGPGYGHGMMWGDGYGRGPWGGRGYGHGPGMMEPWWALDLTDQQRTAIDKIMEERYKSHWPLMTKMFEAQRKLDELYNAEKWDSKAIDKAYDELFKVQRQVVEEHVRIHNSVMEQLTPQQREQLKRYRWQNRWRED